jgi:hypothetical protein
MANPIKATAPILRIAVIGACVVGLVLGAIYLSSTKERKTVNLTETKTSSDPKAAIPAIDASVPTQTETATFALG